MEQDDLDALAEIEEDGSDIDLFKPVPTGTHAALLSDEEGSGELRIDISGDEDDRRALIDDSGDEGDQPGLIEEHSCDADSEAGRSTRSLSMPSPAAGPPSTEPALPTDAVTQKLINSMVPLAEQAQVLIANAFQVVTALPRKLVRQMFQSLVPDRFGSKGKYSYTSRVVSRLLRISPASAMRVFTRVRDNAWQPPPPGVCVGRGVSRQQRSGGDAFASDADEQGDLLECPRIEEDIALLNVTRTALSTVVEGQSFREYERVMYRMRLAGAQVGTKYLDRRFVAEVVALASMVLQQLDAFDWNSELPGLGIPSDVAVLADPVSIGMQVRQRHDSLLVVALSLVSRHTGRLYCPMHSGFAMPFGGHSGDETAKLMLFALASHPAAWGVNVLRARCASICGDGALVLGGPEHRHRSTGAAEKLWATLHGTPVVAYPDQEPVKPPTRTVWDPFHRADNAAWRAIGSVPLAVTVFDASRQADNLFAQSEGVLFFRGVAEEIGETPYNIRAPGGTRKIVYLSGAPSSLVANYRTMVAGLRARVAWKQSGHSTQKIQDLLELGRTLSDPVFVMFMLLLSDVLGQIVKPFATIVQGACEPCVMLWAQQDLLRSIAQAMVVTRRVRILSRVVCLCRQHAPLADLRNLVLAFLPRFRRCFPTTSAHMLDIMLPPAAQDGRDQPSPMFQGTRLQFPLAGHDRSQQMTLGPHCQCHAYASYRKAQWDAAVGGRRGVSRAAQQHRENEKSNVDKVTVLRGNAEKTWDVPYWVKYSFSTANPLRGPLEQAPPRFHVLKQRNMIHVPGMMTTNMYRRRILERTDPTDKKVGTVSRCQVPYNQYLTHEAIDKALSSCLSLLRNLRTEFGSILQSVGCNEDVAALLRFSGEAFDWSTLVLHPPSVQQVRAFRNVARKLRPCMLHTVWPSAAYGRGVTRPHGGVELEWPRDETLCAQYLVLLRRVRMAAAGDPSVPQSVLEDAKSWTKAKEVRVLPLYVNRVVLQMCKQRFVKPVVRIAWAVSAFAGFLPEAAWESELVSPEKLRPQECVWRQHSRRGKRKRGCGVSQLGGEPIQLGHAAVMLQQGKKRLVIVDMIWSRSCITKVCAALDLHPFFSLGSHEKAYVAWGAARLAHRCRTLFPPDSACERAGSFMRLAWDQRSGQQSPVFVADRTLLMHAGVRCLGGERDEMIVREVVHLLKITAKYNIGGSLQPLASAPAWVNDRHRALEESGRFAGALPEDVARDVLQPSAFADLEGQGVAKRSCYLKERARSARPKALPKFVSEAVQNAMVGGDVILPLPPTLDTLHASQRGVAASTMRTQISSWLDSEEGRQWMKEREELFDLKDGKSDAA